MMAVSVVQIYLDNGRKKWDSEARFNYQMSTIKNYTTLCFKLSSDSKKLLKIAAVCAIVFPLFMYRSCLTFYNAEVGYYNHKLGFGVNTYFTRMFQLKTSCPPGPPCHMYATVPEDPSYAFFLNLHTHKDVG